MTKWAIDFQGWLEVEASDSESAMLEASHILGSLMPSQLHEGYWEITGGTRLD